MTRDDHSMPATTAGETSMGARSEPGSTGAPHPPGPAPADPALAPGAWREHLTACGQRLHKGKEGEADRGAAPLTVCEAARVLGCSGRTVRRWLQTGRLTGQKRGRDWVVWGLPPPADVPAPERPTLALVRRRLRAVGARLITVGNTLAAPALRPGAVLLAWRAPRSLRVGFAIGRTHPTRGWTPIALGLDYPFWLEGRSRWHPVLPLLRRYERLRLWCATALLRIPGVRAVVLGELARLEAALAALRPPETPTATPLGPEPEAEETVPRGVDASDTRVRALDPPPRTP